MTKQEFQKRIGAEISQKDYSIVEHVYTWHPSISEVEGKGLRAITSWITTEYGSRITARWSVRSMMM